MYEACRDDFCGVMTFSSVNSLKTRCGISRMFDFYSGLNKEVSVSRKVSKKLHKNSTIFCVNFLHLLTRVGGRIFGFHPKIWYLNFKSQYLQNFSSPTNDLYSVRKKSIRAFKSIFKLPGWGPASNGSGLCAKALHARCL